MISATLWNGRYLEAAVDDGRLSYSAEHAAECLQGIAALSCEALLDSFSRQLDFAVPACDEVLRGLGTAGAPCTLGNECAPGHRCVISDSCPGQCQAYAAVDAACSEQQPCDPVVAACLSGTCRRLPGPGGDCSQLFCLPPLACAADTRTCQPAGLEGAVCDPWFPACFPGLICLREGTGDQGRCRTPRAPGESCFDGPQCMDPERAHVLVCAGGTCATAPGPEEPCYDLSCDGAWCDVLHTPPMCTALPAAGAACANGRLCAAGLRCSSGTCQPLLAEGGACGSNTDCASGRCAAGICRPVGEPPCPQGGR